MRLTTLIVVLSLLAGLPAWAGGKKGKGACGVEEKTRRGLPVSPLKNVLPKKTVRSEVEMLNEMCGDTFCEGSFEFFFHGIKCDGKGLCHLDFRMYDRQHAQAKLGGLVFKAKGKKVKGLVVTQKQQACCKHPGLSDKIRPCTLYETRCEIKIGAKNLKKAEELPQEFSEGVGECIMGLEEAIRKKVPEFFE